MIPKPPYMCTAFGDATRVVPGSRSDGLLRAFVVARAARRLFDGDEGSSSAHATTS